jgi:flagellar hook-length control protein FliK
VRFVQRVERAFAAMGDGGGTVRLKLNPPELGSVHMEITVIKGVMKARLEAETKEAKNLLLENLPALRDRLAQQNIKIQKFDVDLRDPSSGGAFQQSANQAETGSGGGGYRSPQPQSRENAQSASPTAGAQRIANHNGQLNVIV